MPPLPTPAPGEAADRDEVIRTAMKELVGLAELIVLATNGADPRLALAVCALAGAMIAEYVPDGRDAFTGYVQAAFDRVAELRAKEASDAR